MPSVVQGDIKAPPNAVYDLMANVLEWGRWRAKDPEVKAENSPVSVGDVETGTIMASRMLTIVPD